jgi:hypothetical protein
MRFSEIDITEIRDALGRTTYHVRGIDRSFANKAIARSFLQWANEHEQHMLAKWDEVAEQIQARIQEKIAQQAQR